MYATTPFACIWQALFFRRRSFPFRSHGLRRQGRRIYYFCGFNSMHCHIYVLDSQRRQSRLAPYEACGFGRCFRIASGQTQ
jgi:hypothetical protein